jgi:CYTH domain-containing protein
MIEIERKFLVKHTDFLSGIKGKRITQGYLSSDPERNVRVRIKEDTGFLTIKGISNKSGLSRFEWEKEITLEEAQDLLKLCLPGIIDKTRYEVASKDHIWEIDIFHRENDGLIIAEVELKSEEEIVIIPEWIDREVTGDKRYYNSYLSEKAFETW